jgi:hypothetical protein
MEIQRETIVKILGEMQNTNDKKLKAELEELFFGDSKEIFIPVLNTWQTVQFIKGNAAYTIEGGCFNLNNVLTKKEKF